MSEFRYEDHKFITKAFKDYGGSGNATYGFLGLGEEEFRIVEYHYCHAGLYHSRPINPPYNGIATYIPNARIKINNTLLHKYYTWLVKESIFTDVFLSHDIDEILANQYLIMSSTVSNQKVFFASILSRLPWENYDSQKLWKTLVVWEELVDSGVNKEVALVLSYNLVGDGPYQFRKIAHGHCPFVINDVVSIRNFMNLEGDFKATSFNEIKTVNYPSTNLMFGNELGSEKDVCDTDTLDHFISTLRGIKEKSSNPFSNSFQNTYTIEEIIEATKGYEW